VGKKFLQGSEMSSVAYVDQAAEWSRKLTQMRARGPGDTDNAMRSIERDYGIAHSILWSLRYRRDRYRSIGVDIYARLSAAYAAECERQVRKLSHEIEITKAVAGSVHPAVVSAEALVGAHSEPEIEQGVSVCQQSKASQTGAKRQRT
jgi:hypothetical protein